MHFYPRFVSPENAVLDYEFLEHLNKFYPRKYIIDRYDRAVIANTIG